jgi:hypothetical protein
MTAPLLALWAGLAASAPARQARDSAQQARLRTVVTATFDAFDRLRGATHQFTLDLDHASNDLVQSRAARVTLECLRTDSALLDLERILASPLPTPAAQRQVRPTRAAARAVRAAMARCASDWGSDPRHPAQPDSLRAWGPYRTNQLEATLRRHAPEIQAFAHAAGADPKR